MPIPEWLKLAKKDSSLNLRDIKALFDMSKAAIEWGIRTGTFPAPDYQVQGLISNKHSVRQWKVPTILSFIRQQHLQQEDQGTNHEAHRNLGQSPQR